MGIVVDGLWSFAWRQVGAPCPGGGECLGGGLVIAPLAVAFGILIVAAGTFACFGVLGVRPLPLTSSAATVLSIFVARQAASAVPGGRPPAWWLLAGVLATTTGLVAVAAVPGWPRVVGVALVVVLVPAAVIVPKRVQNALQLRAERARFAALRFPLVAPHAPGYKIADAYPSGDVLFVDMVAASARRDRFGAYKQVAFSVIIGPVTDSSLAAALARCLPGSPGVAGRGACRSAGPERWLLTHDSLVLALSRHGRTAAEATAYQPGVPAAVLEQAVTNLRPTTVAALLSAR
jgi:hypothetical protein